MTYDDFNTETSNESGCDIVKPLGTGEFDGENEDFALGGEPDRKVNTGTLIIIGVVLLSAVGLYSMRSLAIAMAGGDGDTELETTIEGFLEKVGDGSGEQVIAGADYTPVTDEALVEDRTEFQVPLDDVQRNPFISFLPPVETAVDSNDTPQIDSEDPAVVLEAKRRDMRDRWNKAARNLKLAMVMGGSDPMANISGRIFHLGDVLPGDLTSERFTVEEIDSGYVIIAATDAELDLHHRIVLRLHDGF